MPSKSKSQQRFFGLVRKCQKTGKCLSPKIKKVANKIKDKDAKDFASTKHKGLPNKIRKRKRKTFKEYLEIEHPEFDCQENALGFLTNLGLGAAAILKTAMKKNFSSSTADVTSNYRTSKETKETKNHIWTNKEETEHKEGSFVKKENNMIYIRSKDGNLSQLPINWFSEKDLKYVGAIEELNKIANNLKSLKDKINITEDKTAKEELLRNYKQLEIDYEQADIKVKSFDN